MIANIMKALRWPTLEGRRIELDFARGVAILLACGWHFNQVRTGIAPLDWLLVPGRTMGWAGVDLFFVLSGFLIGGILFSEFEKEGGFRPGRFLIRRAFKIWPVLYAFLILQLLLDQHPWRTYFLQCLFHVQNFMVTPLSHLWSLGVEEQFYLAFAILYALVIAIFGSPRAMPWFLGALMILPLLARLIAVAANIDSSAMMQTQYRIDALACGVGLRYVHQYHRHLFDDIASRKPFLAACWVAGSVMVSRTYVNGDFMHSAGYTLVYLSAAAFLLFCYDLPAITARPLAIKIISHIGLFSYAIYICQYAAVRPAIALVGTLHLSETPSAILKITLDYSGAFIVAIMVTILIERPMLMLRDFLAPEPRPRSQSKGLLESPAAIGRPQQHPRSADGIA